MNKITHISSYKLPKTKKRCCSLKWLCLHQSLLYIFPFILQYLRILHLCKSNSTCNTVKFDDLEKLSVTSWKLKQWQLSAAWKWHFPTNVTLTNSDWIFLRNHSFWFHSHNNNKPRFIQVSQFRTYVIYNDDLWATLTFMVFVIVGRNQSSWMEEAHQRNTERPAVAGECLQDLFAVRKYR